jgi:ABC-type sugar transport system substrate-binding protein
MPKYITWLLVLLIVLSIVSIALIATIPRVPSVTTVTMPITIPTLSIVTVTAPGAPGATITVERTVTLERTVTVTAPAATPALKPIKIAFLVMGTGYPYWDDWIAGIDIAVKRLKSYGIPIDYTIFDGKYDPTTQYNQILSAIGAYNVIILTPVDRVGLQSAIEQARAAGVLVIVADNAVERDDLMDPFIGSNNLEAAKVEALAAIKALRESGKPTPWKILIIHGVTTAANNVLRLMGYYEALKPFIANGTVKIVDVQCGYDSIDRGYSATLPVLAREKVDAIISTNDEQAIGAIRAIEDSGLVPGKDIIVVGLNGIPQAIEAIKAGKMYATVSQAPFVMGYYSTFLAFYRLYFGFDPVKAAGGKNWIVTPTPLVTKENVDTYISIVKGEWPLPLPNEYTKNVRPISDVMGLINALKTNNPTFKW